MGYGMLWNQSVAAWSSASGSRQSRGAAPTAGLVRYCRGSAGARETRLVEEGQDAFAQLHAEMQNLRACVVQIKAEYEAGQLSLDEEIALFREIEREMAAIEARMVALVSQRP